MNKSEFVSAVAERAGLSKADAQRAVDAMTDTVTQALFSDNDIVNLTGFGSFSLSRREAREGRNPATGESLSIPATNTVKFKPGKPLKEAVNN